MTPSQEDFNKGILYALRKEIERVTEEEIKKSQAEIERRVRARTGEIVAMVYDKMSFERFGNDLRITVHFPWRDTPEMIRAEGMPK